MPETSIISIAAEGSHRISNRNGKVVIHDLELFSAFDPSIDDGADELMTAFDNERILDIVERTHEFMGRGQNPKFVLRHQDENGDAPQEAVGDIVKVRRQMRRGVAFIVGDIEMSPDDFDSLIRSNKYPRRSAEIWEDGHMSEVALLGRETPRRPLPDTKFQRTIFNRPLPPLEFGAPGPSNVIVPTTPENGDEDKPTEIITMPCDDTERKDVNKSEDEGDDKDKMIATLKAEIAKLKQQLKAKAKAEDDGDKDDMKAEDDEGRERVERDDDEVRSKGKSKSAKTEATRMQRENDILKTENKRMGDRLSALERERFAQLLSMEQEKGLHIADDEAILQRIMTAPVPQEEFDFIKTNFARDPIGVALPFQDARTVTKTLTPQQEELCASRARDTMTREGKQFDMAMFKAAVDEERAKFTA